MKFKWVTWWSEFKEAQKTITKVRTRSRHQIRRALVDGAKFYKREASRSAPVDTGELQADFVIVTENTPQYIQVSVGPSTDTAYRARWMEYGTKRRFQKGIRENRLHKNKSDAILAQFGLSRYVGAGGIRDRYTGYITAKPFMRPAWDRSVVSIQNILKTRFALLLQTEVGTSVQSGSSTLMEG